MKFRAEGSKLGEMPALPARWSHWMREWLGEILAVRTDLVSRRTHRSGPAVRSRPYDGFALAAAGHAKLCQLEQELGGAGAGPVWISVPLSDGFTPRAARRLGASRLRRR